MWRMNVYYDYHRNGLEFIRGSQIFVETFHPTNYISSVAHHAQNFVWLL